MAQDLDSFIKTLKAEELPFKYVETVKKPFLLSYDESIESLYNRDFRSYIAAVLHVKGATKIKSQVASTIEFEADSESNNTIKTLKNWEDVLIKIFTKKDFKFVLCAILEQKNNTPLIVSNPDVNIQQNFDLILKKVIAKINTL